MGSIFKVSKLFSFFNLSSHQIILKATYCAFSKSGLHTPVMADEVITMLKPKDNHKFLDLTFGAGGHTRKLLSSADNVTIYALDRDPLAYELAIELSSKTSNGEVIPLLGKFSDLPHLLGEAQQTNFFDGVLIDCGCSSMQYDVTERGFSISKNGPLDMRMDQNRVDNQPSAADILAHIDEGSLVRVLKTYGEEKQAKKIARAIIEARYLFSPLKTTKELAQLVENVCSDTIRTDKLKRPAHVATKTFQALRILVNDELNELDFALKFANQALKIGGKIVTIAFHSLEDRYNSILKYYKSLSSFMLMYVFMNIASRIVKGHLHEFVKMNHDQREKNHIWPIDQGEMEILMQKKWQAINKHVLVPSDEEVITNPRSRSAKLRAAIRLQ